MDPSRPTPFGTVPATAPAPPSRSGEVGRWVLELARQPLSADAFPVRRARAELRSLAPSPETRLLGRVVEAVTAEPRDRTREADVLLEWAGFLEARGRLGEASDVLGLAMDRRDADAELTLHAARVARKSGEADRARALYQRVRTLDGEDGPLGRMARLGDALLDDAPEAALGRVLRDAVDAGDREAAAVAQEERARVRRTRGDLAGALRDALVAAARFRDPVDRGRLGHTVADLMVGAGDPLAARRVLLEVEGSAHPEQVRWARSRLRGLARTLGDEFGKRRWKDAPLPGLVSLSSPAGGSGSSAPSRAPALDRWIRRLRSGGSVLPVCSRG